MPKIIINGPLEHAQEALDLLKKEAAGLDKCKIGHGWGFGSFRRPSGATFFLRRTKSGYSVYIDPPKVKSISDA